MIIGGINVNKSSKVLIIAEAGINHDGNLNQAFKLIDIAKNAGADIVKFQLFKANKVYGSNAGTYTTAAGNKENIIDIMKTSEMPEDWLDQLIEKCNERGIGFLCTVGDENAADTLLAHGVDSFKLASYGITHIPLLKHIAKKGKPIIFSSAGANLSDVDIAIRTLEDMGSTQIALMHCVAKYPTPLNECNLDVLRTFQAAFPEALIGYSDHTAEPCDAPVCAVMLGAKIIEKHFTLDKKLPGADHSFSLDPTELKEMCEAIRIAEKELACHKDIMLNKDMLGTSRKIVRDVEEDLRKYAYRTIIATENIEKGELLTNENIGVLRPGNSERGLEPFMYETLVSKKARVMKSIKEGESLQWEHILMM